MEHPNHLGRYDGEIWKSGDTDCYSFVGIPLLIGKDIYGLIKVENKQVKGEFCPFSKEDLYNLKIFLAALSNAIQQNKEIMAALGKYFVFVLMPFEDKYRNIYDCIKQAAEKADMFCARSDEEPIIGKISTKIYDMINKADIVISIMSERNPNVFYETGYSHALNKPTIHVADDPDEIPFDLKDFNHVIYTNTDLPLLRDKLIKYFEYIKVNILTVGHERKRITIT
jgi:nucleoside 2-deoxyribosyltransferase